MIIHLNEGVFQRLFLTEATTEEIYQKYYSDIPYNVYCRILELDPTYANNRMGRYTKWLLNIYRTGAFKEGDFGEAKQLLSVYDKYKNVVEVKDIMTLHSMGELYQVVQPYMGGDLATSKSDAIRITKEGAEKVYEDSQWLIVVPHTKEAAILYGKNTQWCTAAEESENMFDYYNNQGKLYINIDKTRDMKYQFHFESLQFMNAEDESIFDNYDGDVILPDPDTSMADLMKMSPGAKNYYKQLYAQGVKDAAIIVCSPVEFLQVLIRDGINTSKYGMDIVNDEPANPGDVGYISIFGWSTYVRYKDSYVVESQYINKWFLDAYGFIKLDKPINTKNGICKNVASVLDENESGMIIDEKGNAIFKPKFNTAPEIASNGYAVGKYTNPHGRFEMNIFDLNNGCTPVFDTPFSTIRDYSFTRDGGKEIMKAIRYVDDGNGNMESEYYYINAYGFEFNYTRWFNEMRYGFSKQIRYAIDIAENDYDKNGDENRALANVMSFVTSLAAIVEESHMSYGDLDERSRKILVSEVMRNFKHDIYSYIREKMDYLPDLVNAYFG